jgi:hypothetical protein
MAIKISVPSKKAILRSYVLENPAYTITKEELDLVDEKFFGNVYTVKNGVRNPIKTHVSEVIQELEDSGIGYKISIPSRKGTGHEQLLFVKYAK